MLTDAQAALILEHLRGQGCDCAPDLAGDWPNVDVGHDPTCNLLLTLEVDGNPRATGYTEPG